MCGLLATINCKVDNKSFSACLDFLKRRGPDCTNYFHGNTYSLGHTRLSIIDTSSNSNQPFVSSDDNHIIVYNGEIFNYIELAIKYDLKLRTDSDTEVVLELFKLLGSQFIHELNGMFSFCIIDKRDGSYFVARDRYGIKPLYWMHFKNGYIKLGIW